ncbi:MAG TPA: hypothetical protein VMX55_10475 [candidate division Zixibacteria bacterium]|nr:hypothetical protein [candidate division Zixibacteria bacterium]
MSDSSTLWAWPWWAVMVSINVANLVVSAIIIRLTMKSKEEKTTRYQKWMLIMGTIFTVVGLYRSIFVSIYYPQRAWFDTVANSSLLIRLFAIFAELSFSGLIAFSMLQFNTYLPANDDENVNKFMKFIKTKSPYILIICIFLAQFPATAAVITKFELLGAIEETLWLIGFLSILPLAIIQLRQVFKIKEPELKEQFRMLRTSTIIILAWCIIYCSYGLFFHMYEMWVGVVEQLQTGFPAIQTGLNAIVDAFMNVNVSRMYGDWGWGFLLWHSAYFSICVWISLYLMQAPRPQEITSKQNKKLTITLITLMILVSIALIILFSIPAFT